MKICLSHLSKAMPFMILALLIMTCSSTQKSNSGQVPSPPNPWAKPKLRFPEEPDYERRVPGKYMKAFLVAHEAFIADSEIPSHKEKLENYSIRLSPERKDVYLIIFVPKQPPSEELQDGGETDLGKAATYAIDKKTYRMVARMFHK